jgi:undecaprenyl-diphosphatase
MRLVLWGAMTAVLGVVSGLIWRWPPAARWDVHLFSIVNGYRDLVWIDRAIRLLRPLGTAWALLLVMGGLAAWQMPVGALSMGLVAGLSGLIERGLKVGIGRRRPFETLTGVHLRQSPPRDPSFPSGDASRVCYLASGLTFGLSLSVPLSLALFTVAAFVSAARVRVGVHYPTDAWAGSLIGLGMGMIWAGLLPAVLGLFPR